MSSIGFSELLFIAVVALLVFGPEKLPGVIKTTASYIRQFKRTLHDVKSEVSRELDLDNLKKDWDETNQETQNLIGYEALHESLQELRQTSQTLGNFDDDGYEYADKPASKSDATASSESLSHQDSVAEDESDDSKIIYDDIDISQANSHDVSTVQLPDPDAQADTGIESDPTSENESLRTASPPKSK